jgi:hypothetical protein
MTLALHRRHLLLAAPALLAACNTGPKVYEMKVTRDVGCVCCHGWVEALSKSGRFRITMFDAGDPSAFKQSVGVPDDLAGCHTGIVNAYVVEGHVPEADILRLLEQKPKGVLGLAVPGMPRGSPGMEQPNGLKDEFWVYAFDKDGGQTEFAHYAA